MKIFRLLLYPMFLGRLIDRNDLGMFLFHIWYPSLVRHALIQPGVSRVSDNSQQPGPSIASPESVESLKRADIRLLNHILRVLIILNDPACKIIGCVKVRQKDLIELAPFVSHYLENCSVRQFIPGFVDSNLS